MNDDYNINNDDSLNEESLSTIDGQIGIEELFIRDYEEDNPSGNEYIPPMKNQISLEDLTLKDLIGKDIIHDNKPEESKKSYKDNYLDNHYKNNKLSDYGANMGLESDLDNRNLQKNDIIEKSIDINDTKLEEGISALEDNNNMNGNNNFENENNKNYLDNENYENNQSYDTNQDFEETDSNLVSNDNWGTDASNLSDDNYENNGNNYNNNDSDNDSDDAINNFFGDEQDEQNENIENNESINNIENNYNEDIIESNGSQNNDIFDNSNINNDLYENANDNINDDTNSDIDSDQTIVYNVENNELIDAPYGGNVSSEDAAFSVDDNSISEEDSIDTPNDNYDNNTSDDDTDIDDTNVDNGEIVPSDDNIIDAEDDSNVEESDEEFIDNNTEAIENNLNDSSLERDNASVSDLEKQVKLSKVQTKDENYYENNDSVNVIKDIDNLNKDYEEVDVTVGKDAFVDYESSTLITGTIDESEEVDVKDKVYNENSGQDVVDGMLYKNLDTVLHESMIPYSEHVILDRALPRVEDGLKPVQRRILYSMLELGVTPDKPYRKSARIVGDCLGKYHPHGDTSVYDAMVRMAQPFNTNMLLVSGHGNFGSVDGDGAAAMRYTEARLAPLSMELLRDLDKNTVKWGLNFDDTLKEPEILPGRFPNLLVNGATGIAVGLATNIPPHNLAEAIDGVIAYLNNPSITLKEMLKIIKGPDFPTGAYILNSSELFQAYQTGRGKIYMRAKMHIESNGNDKRYIVITELPYQVNKSSLLQKIANYKDEDKFGFGGISEVRDESDREGLRAVIRLKKDADLKTIYKSLLKNTELQTTFGINMVAIANGKPKQMGLLDIISYYAEYQREIIYRRSKYELEQAKEREHILSGLIIAIKNIDAVVKIIKTSHNTTEAKKRLKEKFNLSDRQAQAILDMRLAKLTSLEVYKLEEELKKLRELIKKLNAIIASKKLQKEIVKDEMLQIKRQYKQDRKTRFAKLEEDISSAPEPKEEANQKAVILKSVQNNFKCVSMKQYNYAQKEVTDNSTLFDTHTLKFETETNNTIIAFSSLGNCFKVEVKDFSLSRYRDKGVPEKSIFKELAENETIVAIFDNNITAKQGNFIFLTKYGMIKKTAFTEYALLKKYYQGMKLKDDDEILSVFIEPKEYSFIFVTKQGMVLNAENSDVPLQGRISGGVKGINLASNDYCVGASLATDGGEILAVTNKGYAKRVLVANVDKSARYRKGLKFFTFTADNGKELIFANVVTMPYTLGCVDNEGTLHYRSTDHVPIESRTGKGKAVDRMKKSLSIISSFAINN